MGQNRPILRSLCLKRTLAWKKYGTSMIVKLSAWYIVLTSSCHWLKFVRDRLRFASSSSSEIQNCQLTTYICFNNLLSLKFKIHLIFVRLDIFWNANKINYSYLCFNHICFIIRDLGFILFIFPHHHLLKCKLDKEYAFAFTTEFKCM